MSRNYRTRKGKKPRNRKLAALLALVGGSFGVHKFYLNQPGQGIMFIFLFTMAANLSFPLTAVLGVFDAFRLLSMSDEQFHHKYNRGAYVNPTHRDSKVERRRQEQLNRTRSTRPTRGAQPRRAAVQRANPFKKSGIAKYKDFDLDGAIADFSKGLEINENDIALHFNIANAYSLTEQKEKAYYHLDRAVDLGFQDFDLISTKDDLAFVRIQPEWEAFKANGFQLKRGMMSAGTPEANPTETDDVLLSQLNKLSELRKKGLLSEEEFMLERKRLMNRR